MAKGKYHEWLKPEGLTRIQGWAMDGLTDEEIAKKSEAIDKFISQNEGTDEYPGTKDYTFAFCKRDEFYWEITY